MRKEAVKYFKEKGRRNKVILALVAIFLFIVINGALIYLINPTNVYFSIVKKIVPYPALIVGREYITFSDYDLEFFLNKKLYEIAYRLDFGNTEEGRRNKKALLEKTKGEIIEKIIMEEVLKGSGKSVTKQDISKEYDNLVKDMGSDKETREILKYAAGVKERDVENQIYFYLLKNRIKESIIYNSKLKIIAIKPENISNDGDWKKAEEKASKALQEIKANASAFNNYYALDSNKQDLLVQNFGREIYFVEDLPDSFRGSFFNTKVGEVSEVIKGNAGYYIFQKEKEGGSYKGTFDEFIREQKNKIRVIDFIR